MDEETEKQLSAKIAADEIDKRISSLTVELDRAHETLGRDYRFPVILTAGILAIVGRHNLPDSNKTVPLGNHLCSGCGNICRAVLLPLARIRQQKDSGVGAGDLRAAL